MIEINHLTKTFGSTIAVDDLTLSIGKGEFFCFLGPNGAGKTTTIKVMTGLLKPTKGHVCIGGYDIDVDPIAVKSMMSYIPDFPYIYEKLTGREFLRFIAKMYAMDGGQTDQTIDGYLEMFSLGERADHLMEDYSHGMRQKIVISAACLRNPRVVIVDEPMVGLDPKGIRQVKDLFRDVSLRGGAVFMSTHILSLAEELATRIGIIHKGRLLWVGTKEELAEKHGHEDFEDTFLKMSE